MVIVPSVARDYYEAVKGNKKIVSWILQQYNKGAEVATMCTGTFMLAAAGMLDGKNCSTHWSAAETFRSLFPLVNLQADQLITDERDGVPASAQECQATVAQPGGAERSSRRRLRTAKAWRPNGRGRAQPTTCSCGDRAERS